MADNDSNNMSQDVDMSENDGDRIVTMMDVLQEEAQIEEDANAVLGASDEKNCTYSKGYIKRQALYACVTCCPLAITDSTKRAAFCLACSLHCHENHDLIELYTKRNFKCDCGNAKFTSKCQFTLDKSDYNDDNKYNQNFSGKYCICNRPYPDPEASDDEDMIQCIICEDWFHTHHLDATVPSNDQYSEMICKACMDDNLFLHDYSKFAVGAYENGDVDVETNGIEKCNGKPQAIEEESKVDEPLNKEIPDNSENKQEEENDNKKTAEGDEMETKADENADNTETTTDVKLDDSTQNKQIEDDPEKTPADKVENENRELDIDLNDKVEDDNKDQDIDINEESANRNKRKLSTEQTEVENNAKKANIEEQRCIKPRSGKTIFKGATFWPSDFRQKLCTCNNCIEMYKDMSVLFLIDSDDTVTAYEALGQEKSEGQPTSQYERGLQALSSLGRVEQINALTEYNNMKDKLIDFLKNFKDRKEIVKETDIKEFFAGMKARKEPDGVYFYHKY